jgi:hypothetical protein
MRRRVTYYSGFILAVLLGCGGKGSGYQCRVPAGEVRVVGIAGAGSAVSSTKVGYPWTCSWGFGLLGVVTRRFVGGRYLEHHIHSTSAAVGMTDALGMAVMRQTLLQTPQGSYDRHVRRCMCLYHVMDLVELSTGQPSPPSRFSKVRVRVSINRMEILTLSISGP